MPEISILQSTFERLQRYAKPFVDTPDTVITRVLDALEQQVNQHPPVSKQAAEAERRLNPNALPNLTHSKVLEASIGGQPISKPNWNRLLDEVLRHAMKRAGSFERLQESCPANMVKGPKEDEGFSYLPEIDISVQGQPANGASQAMVTMSKKFGIPLDIRILWRVKDGAAYPGERGRIAVDGS
ncbi:MAG: hypothetical protein OXU42_17865 [Deltaproteobacteria bacterium]|nr:hypothetical protein [Deltaproteobacteria bacterium]